MVNMTSFDSVVERELLGICKQSMLQLGQQLRQYVNSMHKRYNDEDLTPVMVKAMNEFAECHGGIGSSRGQTGASSLYMDYQPASHSSDERSQDQVNNNKLSNGYESDQQLLLSGSTMLDDALSSKSYRAPPTRSAVSHRTSTATATANMDVLTEIKMEPSASSITSPSMASASQLQMASTSADWSDVANAFMSYDNQPCDNSIYGGITREDTLQHQQPTTSSSGAGEIEVESRAMAKKTGTIAKIYPCHSCPKRFTVQESLLTHISEHHSHSNTDWGPQLQCPKCTRTFTKVENRNRHVKIFHNANPTEYRCPMSGCGFVTVRSDYVCTHLRQVHRYRGKYAHKRVRTQI